MFKAYEYPLINNVNVFPLNLLSGVLIAFS